MKSEELFTLIEYPIGRRGDIAGTQSQIIQLGLSELDPIQFQIAMIQPFDFIGIWYKNLPESISISQYWLVSAVNR